MNEYDRLYRQAQRYREMYPEGTRILLLHMGDDPRPVEDNMRGTVKYVDDMCKSERRLSLGKRRDGVAFVLRQGHIRTGLALRI